MTIRRTSRERKRESNKRWRMKKKKKDGEGLWSGRVKMSDVGKYLFIEIKTKKEKSNEKS